MLMETDDHGDTRQGQALDGEGPHDGAEGPAPQRHHRAQQTPRRLRARGRWHRSTCSLDHQPAHDPEQRQDEGAGEQLRDPEQAHLAMDTSKTARTTPATAHLGGQRDQSDDDGRQMRRRGHAPGASRFTNTARRSASRMASPTVTSARSGPAYSRIMASCTMVSSRWVAGLSTGSRPLSATMTMSRSGPRANSRCGVATDPGSARVARTMAGRFDECARGRQRQDGDEQRRLGQGADGDRPARSHTPERRARVQAGQRQQGRSHQQEVDEDEEVRTAAQRRVGRDEGRHHRGHRHRGHEHHRCQREDPRRLVGTEALLAEELADVDAGAGGSARPTRPSSRARTLRMRPERGPVHRRHATRPGRPRRCRARPCAEGRSSDHRQRRPGGATRRAKPVGQVAVDTARLQGGAPPGPSDGRPG